MLGMFRFTTVAMVFSVLKIVNTTAVTQTAIVLLWKRFIRCNLDDQCRKVILRNRNCKIMYTKVGTTTALRYKKFIRRFVELHVIVQIITYKNVSYMNISHSNILPITCRSSHIRR